ncbi:MAG: Ig-like domain-containing protein, partial [Cyanobacteria bacterium P01_E01_bin.35]
DIKLAINSATRSLLNNDYNGEALVIDISGDGVSDDTPYKGPQEENGECPHAHFCPPLETARDQALAAGITINGLPIVNNQNTSQLTHEIDKHYEQLVIVGEGSFIEVANDFDSFTAAAKKKILREITYAGGLSAAAVDDPFTTDEDTSKTGNVLSNDTNPENKTLAVIEVNGEGANVGQQLTLPSGALLTANSNGSFTYDPNAQFEELNDGESQLDSFTYSIDDGYGKISSATVSMSVAGVTEYVPPANAAPDAVDDTPMTEKNVAVTIDVLANDTDSDGGTPVIDSVNTDSSDGTAEIVNGEILYTPASNSIATDTFYYTISDGQGGTDTASVTVSIEVTEEDPDAPPVAGPPFAD